jgi:hypothetical protein
MAMTAPSGMLDRRRDKVPYKLQRRTSGRGLSRVCMDMSSADM